MTKIEITDEMVERFGAYVREHEGCYWKDALEFTLNPPQEPEIPVSESMIAAGAKAWNEECGDEYYEEPPTNDEKKTLAAFYRAMEKARRKEAVARCGCCNGKPKAWYANPCCCCNGTGQEPRRRKDDPK